MSSESLAKARTRADDPTPPEVPMALPRAS